MGQDEYFGCLEGAVDHPSSHDGDANLEKWAAVMLPQSIRVRSDPAEFLSVLPQTPWRSPLGLPLTYSKSTASLDMPLCETKKKSDASPCPPKDLRMRYALRFLEVKGLGAAPNLYACKTIKETLCRASLSMRMTVKQACKQAVSRCKQTKTNVLAMLFIKF